MGTLLRAYTAPSMGIVLGVLMWAGTAVNSHAILILGDTGANSTPPDEAYADSGFLYQGQYGEFGGTAVSPNQFITAAHVGSTTFVYQGITYNVSSSAVIAGTDLKVCTVEGNFGGSGYAQLYTGALTPGMEFVTHGRGGLRGDAVLVDGFHAGWESGTYASGGGATRWGTNEIASIGTVSGLNGTIITATFDADGGFNEATFSFGDSGGGVFVRDPLDGIWKLAGVNYAVQSQFYTSNGVDAELVDGAIFDARGLWVGDTPGARTYIPDTLPEPVPAPFYMSSIPANQAALLQVIVVPEPGSGLLLMLAGGLMLRRRR